MATLAGILVFALIAAVGLPLVWVIAHYDHGKHKRLIALENQRRAIARQIVEEHSEADWLTRWLFKRYLRKGGNSL